MLKLSNIPVCQNIIKENFLFMLQEDGDQSMEG